MIHPRLRWVLPVLLLAAVGGSRADWTASGSFRYVDRTYDITGFTGESTRPVRLADVEVVDANRNGKNAVLARGATDAQGFFSIAVPDTEIRDVYVRAVTRSEETSDLHIDVRAGTVGKVQHYAAASGTTVGHAPTVSVDFGASQIEIGQGGEAFNIYDQMLLGMDYLALLLGARPGADHYLSTIWAADNGVGGAYYNAAVDQIVLRDTAGYDDTVILHEMGHYVVDQFSRTDSPGGAHGFSWCEVDIRLAFDEGFATYWGNSAIRQAGLPVSHVYMRSNGAPGPGNAVLAADIESDEQFTCRGATNELNVFASMWDIVDGTETDDATPGIEEAHDRLTLADAEVWEVMTVAVPAAQQVSFEDFWDGWFRPPLENGFRTEMIDVVDHLGIELYEDAFEPNEVAGQAGAIVPSAFPVHATFFADPELDGAGAPDVDLFAFPASAGLGYVVETTDLLGDANTLLELLDTDGQTVLASNDDRAAGDESSRIDWAAPRADTFFVRLSHAADLGIYGSYDLRLRVEGAADADGDGYDPSVDCDDADATVYPGAPETCNGIDEDCDALIDEDANGEDSDGDGARNLCDNCPLDRNADQVDQDADGEGDRCDLDDGVIYLVFQQSEFVDWQAEVGFEAWNLYRGDLAVLRSGGAYTQEPGSNALAARQCALPVPSAADGDPSPGQAAFYLATGMAGGLESSLGTDSAGGDRPNTHPCP